MRQAMLLFIPGQCWISEMEPELGLGRVIRCEGRRLILEFSGGGVVRIYSVDNAPLRRVRFTSGDDISFTDGTNMRIEHVEELGGLFYYHGKGIRRVEGDLAASMFLSSADLRLPAGDSDAIQLSDLRFEAMIHRYNYAKSELRGLSGGRLKLLPHQFHIAVEALRHDAPRLLLADEVGLGKTIEAGLILHGMLLRGQASRVLILVPEPLVNQWFVELLRKFNLSFSIIDGESGEDPFADSSLCLCAMSSALAIRSVVCAQNWDLLIVDEAHHLEWEKENPSPEYAMVEELSASTPAVLLLTATPEHYGLSGHFARLRLLDPGRYYDMETFQREARHYRRSAQLAGKLISGIPLDDRDEKLLRVLLSHDADAMRKYELRQDMETLIETILDRHGVGRVMFRNTRASMSGFPTRVPHLIELPEDIRPETWLNDFIRRHPGEKVLAICSGVRQAIEWQQAMALKLGAAAVFHEEMTLIQRDRAAAWFADPAGCQLMICSEIGSEGRNFQFARHLVMLDLVIDPELIEQRIGRLDRIGQSHNVNIHIPFHPGSREQALAVWYHRGLEAFSHPLQCGARIIEEFRAPLLRTISGGEGANAAGLIRDTRRLRKKIERELEHGRDRLLEFNSSRPQKIAPLLEKLKERDANRALELFMLKLFDHFGIKYEEMEQRTYLLRPDDLLTDAFPGLPREGRIITYNRELALEREDMAFMSWDHPMASGALELFLSSEAGNSCIALYDGGQCLLECVFVLECVAPARLRVDRFMPPVPFRLTLDINGRQHPACERKLRDISHVPAGYSRLRDHIVIMLEHARDAAEEHSRKLKAEYLPAMRRRMDEELLRVEALQQVNSSISMDEPAELAKRIAAIAAHINSARLRLDSLRLLLPEQTRREAGLSN